MVTKAEGATSTNFMQMSTVFQSNDVVNIYYNS